MKAISDRFSWRTYVLFMLALIAAMLLCICMGSVSIPLKDTLTAMWNTLWGLEVPQGISKNIILNVRLPRVINVALVGAALSLCGAAMQGLLRNPLADGSTLGVSSGAALGAVIALAFGIGVPGVTHGGVMVMAMVFAFLSLVLILSLAYVLDRSLSTNSIILIGVIFSMFASSVINLIISFAEDHIKSITFWTMGSLSGTNFSHSRILAAAVLI
jgi:iron complex transport system permease protein